LTDERSQEEAEMPNDHAAAVHKSVVFEWVEA
jgi:hypothetical protein